MIERLLRRWLLCTEIGWAEIGEKFTRFLLLKTPWFSLYLHRLEAPIMHPCWHSHPWAFVAVILWGGYVEHLPEGVYCRGPGDVLLRRPTSIHNVVTRGVNWSLVLVSRKLRPWRFVHKDGRQCSA